MMFKKQFLALICGLIFSFGFAPFDYWLLSILSISVLYKTIKGMPPKEAFYTGYWFGFGMWLTGISWLYVSIHYHGEISIIGSALLILIFISILSIYSGLLLLLNSNLEKYGFQKLIYLSLPVSWVLIELIRSYLFTGFPWLISGTMLADTLIDGYTAIIGAQGNTFFLVLIGVFLCEIYESFSQKRTALFPIIFLFIVLVPSSVLKNIEWTIPDNELKVSLHQPNLTLEDKWSQFGVIKTHGMIQRAIDDATEGELIVFPETALILSEKDNKSFMEMINYKSLNKNLTLLTGIVERESNFKIRNRLQSLGSVEASYDKVKLVPFGEFIPLESFFGGLLDIIGLNLTNTIPGTEPNPINSPNIKISPSICYEIAFDRIVRKTAHNSNILITVSNDTWFGRSIGPEQHLEIAQNRALEHKKPLLRATNSGVSAIISHNGQVIEKQGYFEEKTLRGSIFLYIGNTFYSTYGNLPIILFIILYIGLSCLQALFGIETNQKRTNVT